jgi:vancomycin resistance protein YoaR
MHLNWLLGLFMLSQPVFTAEDLTLTANGEPLLMDKKNSLYLYSPEFPIFDTEKMNHLMDEVDRQVYKEPKNAIIDQSGDIIPEQVGYRLDRQKFIEQIFSIYIQNSTPDMEIPLQSIYPKVDSELLGHIRSEKIGGYETYFNKNNKERNQNIYLAAEAIHNKVLFPGEVFSFNQVVGQRTEDKGYMHAPVIINGEFVEDIGGGICQVSSTLFNAVDNAGLEVIQRYSHSREVSYVPPKRDATVSWNGPDLVFKNKYNQPILIQAQTLKNKLVVEIYSSDVISYMPKEVPYLN